MRSRTNPLAAMDGQSESPGLKGQLGGEVNTAQNSEYARHPQLLERFKGA
jgi:hypothetical protein